MAVIRGTQGNDALAAKGTNRGDSLYGLGGDDNLLGGPDDDYLDGGADNDTLIGSFGNDTLVGGTGADSLHGGPGSDTYVFNFTTAYAGTATVAEVFPGFDLGSDGKLSKHEFMTQYKSWLNSIGIDGDDPNSKVNWKWDPKDETDPLQYLEGFVTDGAPDSVTLSNGQTQWYETSVTPEDVGTPFISSGDGNDIIESWQTSGLNIDVIQLNGLAGLTDVQLGDLFDLTYGNFDGEGDSLDAKLAWAGGSITILDTGERWVNEMAFFNDPQVHLT